MTSTEEMSAMGDEATEEMSAMRDEAAEDMTMDEIDSEGIVIVQPLTK